jgi:hypothetical protein
MTHSLELPPRQLPKPSWLPSPESSPQAYARTAGGIYLLVILFGGFSEGVVMNTLVVSGDMAATGRNLAGSQALWDFSVAGNLIVPLIAIVQLWIEYLLLRPVNRNLAGLFVLLNLASLAVEAVSKVSLILVKPTLALASGSQAPELAYALATYSLRVHDVAFHITLMFFGAACLVSGFLIHQSRYLPRLVGLLMLAAGLSYLVSSLAVLVAPRVAAILSPAILLPALIGESSLCLWLLFKGVKLDLWNQAVSQAPLTQAPLTQAASTV